MNATCASLFRAALGVARSSRPDPVLPEVSRRVEKIALNNPSNLVRRSWPDYGSRLEPPGRLSHEVWSPTLVDRFAQGAQYGLSFGAERHAGVSAMGFDATIPPFRS
jgi:hypothetical protein